jgi:heat shock protein 1/8
MSSQYVIGIDLGTTNSCVAVWRNGIVEVIPNDSGNRTTPSYVAFTETERIIGQLAKDQATHNPENTIFDAKRLIGRKHNDPIIQDDLRNWPFKVTSNQKQQPLILANYKGSEQTFFPEEISAMILSKMKSIAEDFLNTTITEAVITVPAYFNDSQRQATKDAAQIAGLNCLRIINEPTAAALAYGLDRKSEIEQLILIFDLGGGTFDVSLLATENGTFEVIATSGDTHLGGEDFDNRLVDYLCQEFQEKHNLNLRENKKALRKLRGACEKAKIALSSSTRAMIDIDSLHAGIDFNYIITRSKFEDLCLDLFKKCLEPVKQVINDAEIKKEKIDEIILVGGSTRIPLVQRLLMDFFDGKELNKSIHPDEAVASGAAIQAAILSKVNEEITKDIVLLDIIPLSLGVETAGGVMSFIIPRNAPIPRKQVDIFTTYTDRQKAVTINIYEGERQMTQYNNFLGKFDLVDLPPAARGVPQIEVTFDINNNGILTVSAKDLTSSKQNQIKIIKNKGRLTAQEIAKLIDDAEKYKQEDIKMRAKIEAKNKLESVTYQIKNNLNDAEIAKNIHTDERHKLNIAIANIKKWSNENPNADIKEYEQHKIYLEQLTNTIFTRIYSNITKPLETSISD